MITPRELNQELRIIGAHWTVEFVHTLKFGAAFISGASLDLEQGLGSMTRLLADASNAARSVYEQTVAWGTRPSLGGGRFCRSSPSAIVL